MTRLFNWIVDNKLFNIVHICCSVHDELVLDYPESYDNVSKVLVQIMEESAAKYCNSLPIPAEASVSNHWVH